MYSCFAYHRNDFDTLYREVLIFKLYSMGVRGRFFDCLHQMFTNLKAKMKLLSKLSEAVEVLVGT